MNTKTPDRSSKLNNFKFQRIRKGTVPKAAIRQESGRRQKKAKRKEKDRISSRCNFERNGWRDEGGISISNDFN